MVNFAYSALIRNLLMADSTVHDLIGNNIFPIVAEAGTQFPFLVYRRSGFYKGNPNKDDFDNKFTVELAILANSYTKGIEILNNVVRVLDGYDNGKLAINVTNSYEDFQDDTYIEKINLEIKYNN